MLTGTDRARKYWSDLKKKLIAEGFNELSEKIGQLKMEAAAGNVYEKQSKRKVVITDNFLNQIEKAKTDPPILLQDPPCPTE